MSILFATPCYGAQVFAPHFQSCMNLKEDLTRMGIEHDWLLMWNESLVQRARNNLVASFLRTGFRKLMFIDADIEFTTDDVGKLWNMDADVAVGIYRMKRPGSKYAAWVDGELVEDLDSLPVPCEVDYAGTGFMMIDRSVFGKMEKGRHENGSGDCFAWFDPRVEDGVYLSEDYAFCKDYRAFSGKILADPTVRLKHWGLHVF